MVRGTRRLHPWLSVALAGLMMATIATGLATGDGLRERDDDDRDDGHSVYAIGLWGDMPYSDLQALTGVPNLIKDMNRQDLAFTAHDGDLKGEQHCQFGDTDDLCRCALHSGARLLQFTPGAGDLHAGRQ